MLEPCSPVQVFGIRRRGVEVCGCGVVASVTLILLVCCTVYAKICMFIIKINQLYQRLAITLQRQHACAMIARQPL